MILQVDSSLHFTSIFGSSDFTDFTDLIPSMANPSQRFPTHQETWEEQRTPCMLSLKSQVAPKSLKIVGLVAVMPSRFIKAAVIP